MSHSKAKTIESCKVAVYSVALSFMLMVILFPVADAFTLLVYEAFISVVVALGVFSLMRYTFVGRLAINAYRTVAGVFTLLVVIVACMIPGWFFLLVPAAYPDEGRARTEFLEHMPEGTVIEGFEFDEREVVSAVTKVRYRLRGDATAREARQEYSYHQGQWRLCRIMRK